MDSKTANYLARNPRAMMKYQATGRTPRLADPKSPLIDLLERISPRDRQWIKGVRLSQSIGYHPGATFRTAEALLQWLKPRQATEFLPSETHQIKSFRQEISFDDLAAHCSHIPDQIRTKYRALTSTRHRR